MYRSQKSKAKLSKEPKAVTAVGKGKMAPDPPEPDDTTRLSAAGPASPSDSLQQYPSDLVSPDQHDSDEILEKFHSIVRNEISIA